MTWRALMIWIASLAMSAAAAFVMGLWANTIWPDAGDLPPVRPASYEPIRLVLHPLVTGGLD